MKQLFLILALAGAAFGQGSVYTRPVISPTGAAVPGAQIYVCTLGASQNPCTPQVTIYSNVGLSTPLTQPILSDVNGNFSFYCSPGNFTVQVTAPNSSTLTYNDTCPGTGSSTGTVNGSGTANTIPVWTAGTTIGNSSITDNGTTVATTEALSAGAISGTSGKFSGLTSGDCVQASTGGLLTTTGSACGSGGASANQLTLLTAGGTPPGGTVHVTAPVGTNNNNPSGWIQLSDSTYNQMFGVDTACDNTNGLLCPAGALAIYNPVTINDTLLSPVAGKNALFNVYHNFNGTVTALTNQDRAMTINAQNPASDSLTHYSMTGLQIQNYINGTPAYVGAVDGENTAGSFQETDSHSGAVSGPALQTNAIRAEVFKNGTGSWNSSGSAGWNAIQAIAYSSAGGGSSGAGGWMNAVLGIISATTGDTLFSGSVFHCRYGAVRFPTANYCGYFEDIGSNSADWLLYSTNTTGINNSRSFLPGAIYTGEIGPSADVLQIPASVTQLASLTTAQLQTPTIQSAAQSGTTGATSYTYQVVCEDGNGGTTPHSSSVVVANGNATLSVSNYITIYLRRDTIKGCAKVDVYRTASGGTPSTTGKIGTITPPINAPDAINAGSGGSLQDTGLAGDSTSPPTTNTTGTITTNGTVTAANLTLSNVASGTQCLHASSAGVVTGTGSDCGSGGSSAFSGLTSGTNTTAAMIVGSGASLAPTSNTVGTLTANNLVFSSATIPMGTTPTSGQCLEYNGTNITGATCSGGGGGSPGGSNTDVQYNSSSSFGGNAGFTYDGTSVVGIGPADSSHNGVLGLNGETSGQATFTAPAVAGTSTNPVVASNALTLPAGSTSANALNVGPNSQGLFATNSTTLSVQLGSSNNSNLYFYEGTSALFGISVGNTAVGLLSEGTNQAVTLQSTITTNSNNPGTGLLLHNSGSITNAGSVTQIFVGETATFAPTSGAAVYIAHDINPTINQTSSASGNYTALRIKSVETALLGTTNRLIDTYAGSSGTTSEFYVDNKGNTAMGHLNQVSSGNFGGTCSMSSSTTCTVTLNSAYTTPVCIATQQSSGTVIAAECSVSSTTVTVTAASSNSATWGVLVFGNAN